MSLSKNRIFIFSTAYFPLVGGAEVAMKEMTDRLPDWRFDLICARIKPGLLAQEKIGNVTVHRCGFGTPLDKYVLPVLGVWRAARLAREQKPAGIWSLMASYGGFAALVYTWFFPRTKMLLTLQEGDPLEHYAKRTGWLTLLHRQIFRRADVVQAISRFLGAWAVAMGFRGKPSIIPNGVDVTRFTLRLSEQEKQDARQALGFSTGDTILITTSRLSLKNGVDDLIRSLCFLPETYKTLIVGDGEDRQKLEALTREKALGSRVVFVGSRPQAELPKLLQASDIFIRPSLSEGLGNSFLEAMAAGLPIIGTPVGGIPDFLIDGKTGVFCAPRDPESIAKAVLRIQSDPVLRATLIRDGEPLVRATYDWDNIALQLNALLASMS